MSGSGREVQVPGQQPIGGVIGVGQQARRQRREVVAGLR